MVTKAEAMRRLVDALYVALDTPPEPPRADDGLPANAGELEYVQERLVLAALDAAATGVSLGELGGACCVVADRASARSKAIADGGGP